MRTMSLGPRNPLGALLVGALLVPLASSCGSTGEAASKDVVHDGETWLRPSPLLRQQIDDEAARLPWTHGFERLESIRWFASVGEPAYPRLLELVLHPRPDVAAAALAALGATGDRRLVPALQGLDWPKDLEGSDLHLERARTLLRLGDWSEIPALISGLRDERLFTRSLCIEALADVTHERFGFDPRGGASERSQAIERWQDWWEARVREGLVRGS